MFRTAWRDIRVHSHDVKAIEEHVASRLLALFRRDASLARSVESQLGIDCADGSRRRVN